MAINDSFVRELKFKTDINDIISTYVTLKRRGNTSLGLCPFHNEKTPSFTVYDDTQSFYCFGCGVGGDPVQFIKLIENVDYVDAIKILAQRAGMQMPEEGVDDSLAKKRKKILEINRCSARFFNNYMMSEEGKVGLQYFLNRGLDLKLIKRFGLGYAPDAWDGLLNHLKNEGYSISDIYDAGLIKKNKNGGYFDNFRNRVMTPIIDVRGNVIAFGGRVLDDSKPKYINTSDTLVYKKTNELFGLNLAKDSGSETLILCEGYMDVIALHQAGFTNAVAGCGTALTAEQVRLISRYTKEVILAYDADEAGQKALNKAIELFLQTDVKIKVPSFSGGKDPDEIIKNVGKERFKLMLEGASNETEFALLNLRQKHNINTTQGKIDFLNESIKVLWKISPIEQDIYTSRLAEELGVDKGSIKLQLDDYTKKNRKREKKKELDSIIDTSMRRVVKTSVEDKLSIKVIKAQDRLLGLLLLYPDCYKLCVDFDSQMLSAGFCRKVFSLICQRIGDGLETDLMNFSDSLTPDEISKLAGIVARTQGSANPKKEFSDCLNIIKEEYNKTKGFSAGELSDDDFRKLFSNNT